jgi:hypothetical protein
MYSYACKLRLVSRVCDVEIQERATNVHHYRRWHPGVNLGCCVTTDLSCRIIIIIIIITYRKQKPFQNHSQNIRATNREGTK